MLTTAVRTYPWDFPAAMPGDVLDVIRGAWGADDVALSLGIPQGSWPRAHPAGGTFESSNGGFAFSPRERHDPRSRLRPLPLRSAAPCATFEAVLAACVERDIGLRVIVSASRTGRMAEAHADHACRDVRGTRSGQSLCLTNADAQALLAALVEDLSTREGVSAIVLSDVVTRCGEYWGQPLHADQRLGPRATLLGMCFCESCLQEAGKSGLDVTWVMRELDRTISQLPTSLGSAPKTIADWKTSFPHLGRYLELRGARLRELVRRCVQASACPVFIEKAGDADEELQHEGVDGGLVAGWVIEARPDSALFHSGDQAAVTCKLALTRWLSPETSQEGLVSVCKRFCDMGFAGIEFASFGDVHGDEGRLLRQAIRYARRN